MVSNYLLKWEADNDQLRDMKNSQGKIAINIAKNPETKKGFHRMFSLLIFQMFGELAETETLT